MNSIVRTTLLLLILVVFLSACNSPVNAQTIDYRSEMRRLVEEISRYSRERYPEFAVIPQNGQELLTEDGRADGPVVHSYLQAIDGVGREDLFYGYSADNRKTPSDATEYMLPYLDIIINEELVVLSTDYCRTRRKMDDSISKNGERGYVAFAADRRELDRIPAYPPQPVNLNDRSVESLGEAENFLYIINPAYYPSREAFLSDLEQSTYDLFIIDLFDNDGFPLSREDVERLKVKPQGGGRMVLCYMSIGEAEDYRYYWDDSWSSNPPRWMERENPQWKGNFKVRYWDPQWQEKLFGREDAYLDMILEREFDGVYLDIIDAFEYFEN